MAALATTRRTLQPSARAAPRLGKSRIHYLNQMLFPVHHKRRVIEILSMIAILALFFGLSLRRRAKEIERDQELSLRVAGMRGRNVADAKSAFGAPAEIVIASSGWRLYIWKLPEMEITLRVDPADVVTDAAWTPL